MWSHWREELTIQWGPKPFTGIPDLRSRQTNRVDRAKLPRCHPVYHYSILVWPHSVLHGTSKADFPAGSTWVQKGSVSLHLLLVCQIAETGILVQPFALLLTLLLTETRRGKELCPWIRYIEHSVQYSLVATEPVCLGPTSQSKGTSLKRFLLANKNSSEHQEKWKKKQILVDWNTQYKTMIMYAQRIGTWIYIFSTFVSLTTANSQDTLCVS